MSAPATASVSLSLRAAVASAVTVEGDAVAEPGEEEEEEEEEETVRRSVWEERCRRVGRVRVVVCLGPGDRTGMEENSLHRTDVVPAKRSTALRMKIAGWCMECSCVSFVPVNEDSDEVRNADVMTQILQDRINTRRFGMRTAFTQWSKP